VEDRATAIGNMHKKFGKDRECGSGDILMDRQRDTHTHTYTQTYSSQYFATAPMGEVINHTFYLYFPVALWPVLTSKPAETELVTYQDGRPADAHPSQL